MRRGTGHAMQRGTGHAMRRDTGDAVRREGHGSRLADFLFERQLRLFITLQPRIGYGGVLAICAQLS